MQFRLGLPQCYRSLTSKIRVVGPPMIGSPHAWGISELSAMSSTPGVTTVKAAVYQIVNLNSGKMMGVQNEYPFDGAQIQQYEDDGTPDHFWILTDAGGGYFKLQNLATGYVLGVVRNLRRTAPCSSKLMTMARPITFERSSVLSPAFSKYKTRTAER